jgi:ribosomal protein S18 acetylase RimI-like enzyme
VARVTPPVATVRRAQLGDAAKLSEVAEATFRAAFGAMNTAEQMDLHCRNHYGERIQAAEISNAEMLTLLGECDGELAGFAQLRWGPAPPCVTAKRPGEIQRLYVHQDWHGKGVAQQLMNASIDEMRCHDADTLWLGVWEHNPRAISFYKKFGFVGVGEHPFPLGGDLQRDVVMVKPL